MVEQDEKMEEIVDEVNACQSLLYSVFPAPVLERLQNRLPGQSTEIAEKFYDCTFLFAKVVGLKELTDLAIDPSPEAPLQEALLQLSVLEEEGFAPDAHTVHACNICMHACMQRSRASRPTRTRCAACMGLR